jgi:23S rRNA (adenine2503-C2)-methyltransferase
MRIDHDALHNSLQSSNLKLMNVFHSAVDATKKLVFRMTRVPPDDQVTGSIQEFTIEVGLIDKNDGKHIICVPTQTNCAQACRFCHTTEMKGKVPAYNLNAEEMLGIVQAAWKWWKPTGSQHGLLVSFMGVGEPMSNVPNLLQVIQRLLHWVGASIDHDEYPRAIRFGVATMLPRYHQGSFERFTRMVEKLKLPVKLHLSLHYTVNDQRLHWMPSAGRIEEAVADLEYYRGLTKNPIEIHYTAIAGVNDTVNDILRLRELLRHSKVPVKFLKYNRLPGDQHQAPEAEWIAFMRSQLEEVGVPTEWYESPGADIAASCGMFMASLYTTDFIPVDSLNEKVQWSGIDLAVKEEVNVSDLILPKE